MHDNLTVRHATQRLFVYGTLRKGAGHEMHRVLARAARRVGFATVRGALVDLGSYPGLVITDDDAGRVKGEVYALEPDGAEAALALLDAYEGCAPSDPPPHEYRREPVRVTFDDGAECEAWTYVLNSPCAGLPRIADGDYVAWLRRER
ncbi:MAG TPA: gamma-glutamylcyclotransferase family protein [Burkholderiales bacterium]|nr:gamma-glutamylcyclotransferase family protein [Burkholderiales bacterium]